MAESELRENVISSKPAESPITDNNNMEVNFCYECAYYCVRRRKPGVYSCKSFVCRCRSYFDETIVNKIINFKIYALIQMLHVFVANCALKLHVFVANCALTLEIYVLLIQSCIFLYVKRFFMCFSISRFKR